MRQVLTITMHVLGGVAVAAFLFAMLAAPGFLSGSSSTIELGKVALIVSR